MRKKSVEPSEMSTFTDQREAAPARPSPGLPHLIHPRDVEEFQQDYWERQPVVIHRQDPSYYADILTLDMWTGRSP